ncbi:MAG TPA: methyltransferase domain-containing protein, partial [Ilumatobacteraceae bacterium]|nr:methyltransferase domain-containing protein [Ilumatobacteraceae bacterium]
QPGRVLDIGCGIGRNLGHLDGNGVGVDHNPDCVAACRARGLIAFTPDEFATSAEARPAGFDSLLFAHVLEHLTETDAVALVRQYLPFLRDGGRVLVITPQPRGQASDATHVTMFDEPAVRRLAVMAALQVDSIRSFPFPRPVGRVFTHNETVSILSRLPIQGSASS